MEPRLKVESILVAYSYNGFLLAQGLSITELSSLRPLNIGQKREGKEWDSSTVVGDKKEISQFCVIYGGNCRVKVRKNMNIGIFSNFPAVIEL